MGALSFAMRPLLDIASPPSQTKQISVRGAIGEGVLWAVLGGYRSIVADFTWLKSYIAWERRDIPATMANISLATKLDPHNTLFWHMGGGMIAYDMPHWIINERPHTPLQQRHVRELQGRQALEFLEEGLTFIPDSRRLQLNKALIYEKVFNDIDKELEAYSLAAKGDAPLFILRDYAKKLEKAGRLDDALRELKRAEASADKTHLSYKFLQEHIQEVENKLESQKNMLDLIKK